MATTLTVFERTVTLEKCRAVPPEVAVQYRVTYDDTLIGHVRRFHCDDDVWSNFTPDGVPPIRGLRPITRREAVEQLLNEYLYRHAS